MDSFEQGSSDVVGEAGELMRQSRRAQARAHLIRAQEELKLANGQLMSIGNRHWRTLQGLGDGLEAVLSEL